MAMSRSFGAFLDTSTPEMSISPLVTCSRPASMRSAVDLPDPDGPTSTMNSPSPMSRFRASIAGTGLPSYRQVALM